MKLTDEQKRGLRELAARGYDASLGACTVLSLLDEIEEQDCKLSGIESCIDGLERHIGYLRDRYEGAEPRPAPDPEKLAREYADKACERRVGDVQPPSVIAYREAYDAFLAGYKAAKG